MLSGFIPILVARHETMVSKLANGMSTELADATTLHGEAGTQAKVSFVLCAPA
jgi:hypothetical protein